ncbi:MAG: TIGR00266 family protein, partial [Candidatus Eremiobacterota bacterium]
EVDYKILGDDMQMVEIELDPNETVVAEAGAMNYMEDGIAFETKMGDGSKPEGGFFDKLMTAGKRMLSGTSVFLTHFTNKGSQRCKVAFSAAFPGKVIPVNLGEMGGHLLVQKESFLCAALGTTIDVAFTKKLGVGFFGGEGFVLQKLSGDGLVFVHACGTILKRELAAGEKLRLDTGCVVAFTENVKYDIEKAGNLKSMFLGGEGLFLATLTGPGTVWIQSLPFSRLVDQISARIPKNTVSVGSSG